MPLGLRLTSAHSRALRTALFPGDGRQAVALGLCGVRGDPPSLYLLHSVSALDEAVYGLRTATRVTWSTSTLPSLLEQAGRRGLRLFKVHSHPQGGSEFSPLDDAADRELFQSVAGWLDTDSPGVSAIILPSGQIRARAVSATGDFTPIHRINTVGDDLVFSRPSGDRPPTPAAQRTMQAFGRGTTDLLSRLTIGVVGCSGTGSLVAEMLARLGPARLVLVDPERMEETNLPRIVNSTAKHVADACYKVDVAKAAILRMGLDTSVLALPLDLNDQQVVHELAACDVVFGCMDSSDGRAILNRISTYYLVPYLDLGVALVADGKGGIDQICGSVHYLRPGGASLLSMGVITPERVRAEALARRDPPAYGALRDEGYISGVPESRPAVITVNALIASIALNEFLARVHPFRLDPNRQFASTTVSLSQARLFHEPEPQPCPALYGKVGLGDRPVLLGLPQFGAYE